MKTVLIFWIRLVCKYHTPLAKMRFDEFVRLVAERYLLNLYYVYLYKNKKIRSTKTYLYASTRTFHEHVVLSASAFTGYCGSGRSM